LTDLNWVDSEPQTEYERQLGTDHAIYGNVFVGCAHDAINFLRESKRPGRATNPTEEDQRVLCGNLIDGYSDGNPTTDCGDVPASDGVGHLGGESPWEGTPPTKTDVFEQYGQDLHLDVKVHKETAPTHTEFEVPVTITNTREDSSHPALELRIDEHVLAEETVTVPPGTEQDVSLSAELSHSNEIEVTRNRQKVGAVYVFDE
jgi:hypothetical protein